MKTIKKILSISALVIFIALFISIFISNDSAFAKDIEEDANMTMPYDSVITGKMSENTNNSIIVDYVRYTFCKNVRVFGPRNNLVDIKDMGAATEVRLFINKNCVRKIKILNFAQ